MGKVQDDMSSIFDNVKEAALTMQQGGGIGVDFSPLRPRGATVNGVGAEASGPVSFMYVWNTMCATIMSAGKRRGAMMGGLRCDHPDIQEFINAKRTLGQLTNFNMSVLCTDDFMEAVQFNKPWQLKFNGEVYKTLPAVDLWREIMRANYDHAEPGVIFIDRMNKWNPLSYCEEIAITNPCGEQPLPPYGACLLGSINLTSFIQRPFTTTATLDYNSFFHTIKTAIRMLDNVIDLSNYPLAAQEIEAKSKRRIGLGITGLADALIMCGVKYGSELSIQMVGKWMSLLREHAYRASIELAEEKGSFPAFDPQKYLETRGSARIPGYLLERIRDHGLRNSHVTSIAPTGTTSLLANNVSSGIEPVFSFAGLRTIDGKEVKVYDFAAGLYKKQPDYSPGYVWPDYFVTATELMPTLHLNMQAVVQKYVDASVSKTINCKKDIPFEDFEGIYMDAYNFGCKGCTTYRPNDVTGSILRTVEEKKPEPKKPSTDPLPRPEVVSGSTYKIVWPGSPHAFYLTINDIEVDGETRPFEMFINSKNTEHYAWMVALTRMVSAVFRRGGAVNFIAEELQAVFDPRGGQWMNGRYVPSLLAAIGKVLERHLSALTGEEEEEEAEAVTDISGLKEEDAEEYCEQCGCYSLVRHEGCLICCHCGFSECG
jgi:ribonucleoside-diphosphate reductase alpha chain